MSNTINNINGFNQTFLSRKLFINQVTEAKQYEKLSSEMKDFKHLALKQREMYANQIMGLFPDLDDFSFEYANHELFDCALYMCNDTYLSVQGIIPLICSGVSAATCGKVEIEVSEGWLEAGVDQVVEFADSGMRKTACIARIEEPFRKFEKAMNKNIAEDEEKANVGSSAYRKANKIIIAEMSTDGTLSLDALNSGYNKIKNNLKTVGQFVGDKRKAVRTIYKDGTIIGLEKVMRLNGGFAFIINAEGGFLNKLGSGCPELILKGHTHESYSRDTAYVNNIIPYPSLSICNLAQMSIASKIYAVKNLKAVGFVNRLIPYFHMNNFLPSLSVQSSFQEKYNNIIEMLLNRFYSQDMNEDRIIVHIESGSLGLIDSLSNEVPTIKRNCPWMSEWLSKLPGQAIRFSWDVHCWNCACDPLASCITREELAMGIWVARISIPHASFAFSENGLCAFMDALTVIEALQSIPNNYSRLKFINSPIDASVIRKMTGLPFKRLRMALVYLENSGILSMVENPNGNTLLTINPKLLS